MSRSPSRSSGVGLTKAAADGTYTPLPGPDSFTIDSTDASGNVTQITEHFGTVVRVTGYTYNADASVNTETVTVNGGTPKTKTYAYSGGSLTGAA